MSTWFADTSPGGRERVVALIELLRAHPLVTILPPDGAQVAAGLALYASRADKHWSVTDCISFAVMRERGITQALTGDHHFLQAGFAILMKS